MFIHVGDLFSGHRATKGILGMKSKGVTHDKSVVEFFFEKHNI